MAAAPALARAQSAAALTRPEAQSEDALVEQDRVLSGRLLEASHGDPAVRAFRTELHDLDVQLRGRSRPTGTLGAGLALIIPGGLGVVGGAIALITGAIAAAAHASGCAVGTLLGSSGCTPFDGTIFVAGGIAIGAGVLLAAIGIGIAISGRSAAAPFDRRDALREQLRTWVSATVAPTGDGVVVVVGGGL